MTERARGDTDARADERTRVTEELRARLRTRGIEVGAHDSEDDVSEMIEAVERFEDRVRALGGDLMVDVPPAGQAGQPDEPRFKLPLRQRGEAAGQYVSRLSAAMSALGSHRAD